MVSRRRVRAETGAGKGRRDAGRRKKKGGGGVCITLVVRTDAGATAKAGSRQALLRADAARMAVYS